MKYIIEGQQPLKGKVFVNGNKNSILPCLAAVLLTEEQVVLHNVPHLQDVKIMFKILAHLGVKIEQHKGNPHSYTFDASTITSCVIPQDLASKIRASILFLGPLLARAKEITLYPPGGDVIGRRRLDTHIHSLQSLGASFKFSERIIAKAKKLVATNIFQDEASVTATENTIMAAALTEGTTVIENAACEPHVQDVCKLVQAMGAKVFGIGSNILTIEGRKKLGGAEFTIGPDFIEVGSMISLAAVTRSEIEIIGAREKEMKMSKIAFGKLGIEWQQEGNTILVPKKQKFKVVPDVNSSIPTIADAPWPGFPPDLTSLILVAATQAEGTVLIHEKLFESRLFFVDKLVNMGAKIVLCDPHRAVVSGPANLIGTQLFSPDVRAGMSMVIAALGAQGTSTIHNIYEVERGYENLSERLTAIGSSIKKVAD